MSLVEAGPETAAALGIEGKRGALASQIFLGSPADKGGICPGDFITHVDKKEARDVTALTRMVGDLKPGDSATFTVIRDGAAKDIQVRIETRTNEVTSDSKKLWPGFLLVPLTDDLKESLELDKDAKGLCVIRVESNSPADIIGMRQGDLVTALNGENVRDLRGFYRLLREKTSSELWFGFTRSGSTLESLKFRK
ncbi:MAG: PDZ domain-containing protein [Treponema sp.]|nr:PDZ domain-containing protein [Treponema sp.]